MFWNVVEMLQDSSALNLRHIVNDGFDSSHRCVGWSLSPPLRRQCQHEIVYFHQNSLVIQFVNTLRHQLNVAPNALHQKFGEFR